MDKHFEEKYYNDYPMIVHGSEDSIDRDVFFIVPDHVFILSKQELKEMCDRLSHENNVNGNLVSIENGVVVNCYKGTADEVNNGMLYTYHLHDQEHQLPVIKKLPRDVDMKLLRTTRGILSMFSRTGMRAEVKAALRSDKLSDKIAVLKKIDFSQQYDFSQKGDNKDVNKFFAFQLCQCILLTRGVEVFTKRECYKRDLSLYELLYRKPVNDNYMMGARLNAYKYNLIVSLESLSKIDDYHIVNKFGILSVKDETYTSLEGAWVERMLKQHANL